jgi:Tol biopolymer transport system component/serine/threonine protein kinase
MSDAGRPVSRIGPYEVLGLLGEGGMGKVFRARDPRLHRDVAVKLLPPSVALDEERLARFEREARILASLDHQHIAGIYGIEDVGGSRALILELVEGPTLADCLARGPLDLHEALTVSLQTADAIEAAHEQGIVHRDLKPANIKIRADGVVKVLDFGLARAGGPGAGGSSATQTVDALATREGVVMGTPAYMSPEQARGRPVDKRTDIWAFGCVLFEMLTARSAFAADSTADTLMKVLQQEPDLRALPRATPAAIHTILTRCLQKDPRRRLRDIGDARIAIEEALAQPEQERGDPAAAVQRWRPMASPLTLVATALAAGGVTYGTTAWLGRSSLPDTARFDRIVPLVASPANEFSPAISPDGKWVAYLSNTGDQTNVWVQSIAGGDPVNLTANLRGLAVQAEAAIGGIDISPDGTELAFVAGAPGTSTARYSTYVLPVPLGGTARRLLEARQGLRWSPDGKRVAYIAGGGSHGDTLYVADADGQHEREVVKREGARHLHWPRWSHDGRHVYFNYGYANGNAEPTEIFRVAADGGPPEAVVSTSRRAVFPLPGPEGRTLFYAANRDSVELNLWRRDLRTGQDERLTFGVGEYGFPSVSSDGRRLVATANQLRQTLQRVPVQFDSPPALAPLTEGYTGDLDPSWSPDGTRLAFSSSRSGQRNIWWANPDMTRPVAVTSGSAIDEGPVYSPDGSQIAFVSDRSGQRGIWIVAADGGTPRFVAAARVLNTVSWSRDGTRLVYAAPGGELPQIEVIDISSGRITKLPTQAAATSPVWSPVEDLIAYVETRPDVGGFVRFMTGDGHATTRGPADATTRLNNGFVRWSPDGKRLAGVGIPGNQRGYIWVIDPLGPVPFRKLTDLPADAYPRGASWSRDGSSIVVGLTQTAGDIILAERAR